MSITKRYGWEIALALLIVLEILLFGMGNPRLLDVNVLLFSTSEGYPYRITGFRGQSAAPGQFPSRNVW